jgi:hypothetical protein
MSLAGSEFPHCPMGLLRGPSIAMPGPAGADPRHAANALPARWFAHHRAAHRRGAVRGATDRHEAEPARNVGSELTLREEEAHHPQRWTPPGGVQHRHGLPRRAANAAATRRFARLQERPAGMRSRPAG